MPTTIDSITALYLLYAPLKEGVSHVLDPSEGSSKLIPIHEEANHQIVHLFRLGKANGATHEPLHPGP